MDTPTHGPASADLASPIIRRAAPAARRRLECWFPWIVSFALHAVLIITGFLMVWTVAPTPLPPRAQVIVSFENPAPAQLLPEPAPRNAGADRISPAPTPPTSAPDIPTVALSALVPSIEPPTGAQPADLTPRISPDAVRERRLPEVRFAGLGVSNVQDIVYIVDASGSMVSSLPVALNYLQQSIQKLVPSQRFQVIFFGRQPVSAAPHPGDAKQPALPIRLIRASPDRVAEVLAWTRSVLPGGRSNPIPALRQAIALRPDAVFILSNVVTGLGEWESDKPSLLSEVDALNPPDPQTGRRPVVIKTLQFLEEDPAEVMKTIGLTHGGKDGYKFIPRTEAAAP